MAPTISGFEIYKVETPTGRVIGDSTCHYEVLDCATLCLKTSEGHAGWGYGETVSNATFSIPAWYFAPMVSLAEMRACFEREWWPRLKGLNPAASLGLRSNYKSTLSYLDLAVRMALWDLMAQQAELPLYQLLGGEAKNNRVRTYGSLLDFPLTEEHAVRLAKEFASRGFFAIKVKVGAPDLKRDLKRLHAVRDAIGAKPQIAIDANQNWTAEQAIQRIRDIEKDGIKLEYVEDPLLHTDIEGYAKLVAGVDVDIVGHDYFSDPRQARPFLERKLLHRLRAGADLDNVLYQAELSKSFGVPLIFGNSMFEINVHAACALPNVDRLEFSNVAWNELMREPIRFENGFGIAPTKPGHGLDPDPAKLKEWSRE